MRKREVDHIFAYMSWPQVSFCCFYRWMYNINSIFHSLICHLVWISAIIPASLSFSSDLGFHSSLTNNYDIIQSTCWPHLAEVISSWWDEAKNTPWSEIYCQVLVEFLWPPYNGLSRHIQVFTRYFSLLIYSITTGHQWCTSMKRWEPTNISPRPKKSPERK